MSIFYPCPVCGAKPNEPCTNTIRPDLPLPGRAEHFARKLPPQRRTKR